MSKKLALNLLVAGALFTSCSNDDGIPVEPTLDIPNEYISMDFDANVVAENTVINQLTELTSALNDAEANAQTSTVGPIDYPTSLSAVTLPNYRTLVTDWLTELVSSANSADGFQNPGFGNMPAMNQEGGLLGTRLLDEYGLELEQMIEKGTFGAALYNHALTIINGDLTDPGVIDKLVEIHGTDIAFNPSETTAAATYSRRRSNLENQTGFFYNIKSNLITAKAAIQAGSEFNDVRDQALADYLKNWEQSNFATVIFYCNATKDQLTAAFALADGPDKEIALGNAMHAYAEGVAFAHGFKGLSNKIITDAEIDSVLEKLLAIEGQNPQSHRFLNEIELFANLDAVIDDLQDIYGFTDAEVTSFFVNNNP
ncbi:hypothetical protein [Winogradskyella aurantia]|uniref:Uncharacterized protein n=1 Tax=Winogradskyella aurantia TaxID=1915063 RepID=A0A265UQT9_9FLAO|nr:hypothetical protein [Winogradskyella aurantia]OZV67685.1 hypothetical protein CA834_12125 [Winogradskyella aurantia]